MVFLLASNKPSSPSSNTLVSTPKTSNTRYPLSNLTSSQRTAFFSGTLGLIIYTPTVLRRCPSIIYPRRCRPKPTRNPEFLSAVLDELSLREIIRFNHVSLALIGSRGGRKGHDVARRIKMLERDPEFVVGVFKDREVMKVLEVFWDNWRRDGSVVETREMEELEGVEIEVTIGGELFGDDKGGGSMARNREGQERELVEVSKDKGEKAVKLRKESAWWCHEAQTNLESGKELIKITQEGVWW